MASIYVIIYLPLFVEELMSSRYLCFFANSVSWFSLIFLRVVWPMLPFVFLCGVQMCCQFL